jgi:2-methylcitrate dehydratase PrpD
VQEEAIGAASIGEVMATGRIIASCFVLARRAFQAYTGAEATANPEQAFDDALVRRDPSNPENSSGLAGMVQPVERP